MFKRGIRLPFTLAGVPVILDWSFLLILPLLAWIIGSRIAEFAKMFGVPADDALTAGARPFVIGLIAAVGLFVGVVLHELGHAVTARLYGVKVRSITLWFLGGVAQLEEMPQRPGAEAVVAIAGPIVSVGLAAMCWGAGSVVPDDQVATRFVLQYLAYMNLVLGIFNLIPALPLDGGRVLRSLLALAMPHGKATRIAGVVSRIFAGLIAVLGLLSFNFLLLLIAMFIFFAVSAETGTSRAEELLRGVPVGRIMTRDVRAASPDMAVGALLQQMLRDRHLGFPVVDADGRVVGIVTIAEIENKDPGTPVRDVMRMGVASVAVGADAAEAFRAMMRADAGRVIVIDGAGRMVGIVTKTDILRLMQLRSAQPDLAIAMADGGRDGGA